MTVIEADIFSDYYQVHLCDPEAPLPDGAWGPVALARKLDAGPGFILIGTARNVDAPVRLELRDGPPPDDATADLITEVGLVVTSGRIALLGPSDYLPEADHLDVPPGSYRVRIHYRGLGTVDGDDGDDRYDIAMWPCAEPLAPSIVVDRRR